jgi:hypothetical protein
VTFRQIRGVRGARPGETRFWFQDEYFDLFLIRAEGGRVRWFQLCYRRDTWQERVLEWRRGRGFLHMKVRGGENPAKKDEGALVLDGRLPYAEVLQKFDAAAAGLPAEVASFVATKLDEYVRPERRFRRLGARVPRWLERLRRNGTL